MGSRRTALGQVALMAWLARRITTPMLLVVAMVVGLVIPDLAAVAYLVIAVGLLVATLREARGLPTTRRRLV